MFTAPTAIRAIKKEDPNGLLIKKYDVSCLRTQFSAGERCDKATLAWFQEHVGVPAIDHWWQTESGWPMLATMATDPTMDIVFGAAGKPVFGYDIQIVNEQGEAVAHHEEGFVVVKWPLPPGTLSNLWGDTERFKSGYLQQMPGFYFSGDGGYQDENGHFFITGRVDDVINVAGHRLSTSEMEEVLSAHPAVAECAVVGIDDALKGQIPVGLVVEKTGMEMEAFQIQFELVQLVREQIGAVASLRNILVVKRLPKTRSGKILRKVIRALFDNKPYQVPSTIEDLSCLDELKQAWEQYHEQQPKQL
jgi:propionyl-CoA synthetase